jgi:hypothetical protein
MEIWRNLIFHVTGTWPDYEVTMILGAVISIRAEKLLRANSLEDAESLRSPVDRRILSTCNVSSVAEAVGLNRETVRRRIGDLVDQKLLVREIDGSLGIFPGLLELPEVREALGRQVAAFVRAANQLAAIDAIGERADERSSSSSGVLNHRKS